MPTYLDDVPLPNTTANVQRPLSEYSVIPAVANDNGGYVPLPAHAAGGPHTLHVSADEKRRKREERSKQKGSSSQYDNIVKKSEGYNVVQTGNKQIIYDRVLGPPIEDVADVNTSGDSSPKKKRNQYESVNSQLD